MRAACDAPLSTPYACAHPSSLALATEPQGIGEPKASSNPGAVAAAIVDEPAVVSDDESAVAAADEQPPPRFNLRGALARCKTHPTARLKIEYSPGRTVKINGQRPLGVSASRPA